MFKVQTTTARELPEGYQVEVDDGRDAEFPKDDIELEKTLAPKGISGTSFKEMLAEIKEKGQASRTKTLSTFST